MFGSVGGVAQDEEIGAAAVGAEGDIAVSGERPEDIAMHGPGSDGIPRYTRLP